MKHICLLLICAIGLSIQGFSQKEKEEKSVNPPEAVKTAFSKKFPTTSKLTWEKEGAVYEANFYSDGKEMSAVYDSKGNWQETEWAIPVSELPAAATAYVKQHHKNHSIKEASKISKSSGEVNYEANVNGDAIIFDANGKYLRIEKD